MNKEEKIKEIKDGIKKALLNMPDCNEENLNNLMEICKKYPTMESIVETLNINED